MSDLATRLANLSPAQRALLEQRLAQKKPTAEPIAIIGMSCRFAGAPSLAAYWELIRDGREGVGEVTPDRWDINELYDPTGTQPGKMSTRRAGLVENIDKFDPVFFGITPREAARMDPQQRLLLEVAWEALEHGGWPADRAAGSNTGVFVGIGGADYAKVPVSDFDYYEKIDAHMGTGNALSIASNRISYIFDFHGPSASVDTACSSSSLAIHLAVESLRRGECTAALAGGVNAIITPETTIAFSKAHMLSPDGRCKPFDASANGYVRGEGCALVLLKKLSDAERDGDPILGVLRATSVNQDGRTSGISAPNGESQKKCIQAALDQAGLNPADIDYIEAHGTGTPLGDPIEMGALASIFKRTAPTEPPVLVTSAKANIGHTETVSGVAGLIKVLLLMQHEQTPPQLHFRELNPHIQLVGSRITIPTKSTPWPASKRRRLAGVSSFGFGGTNTHLIVEAPPNATVVAEAHERNGHAQKTEAGVKPTLLKIAGKTPLAVERQAADFAAMLADDSVRLRDVAFSANTGRNDFNNRAVVIGGSRTELIERLQAAGEGKTTAGIVRGQVQGLKRPKAALLFTGQGAQAVGMGRELFDTEPDFRAVLDQCDEALREAVGESLLDVLYPSRAETSRINETAFTQPALFAIEYAVASLWLKWGVRPEALLGHSIGEYAAAAIAGVMSLSDALRLVAERGRLMQQVTQHGSMAVLFAGEAEVRPLLAGCETQVSIAALNGPQNTVISGDSAVVAEIVAKFQQSGGGVQPLTVSHAFHSPHMDEALAAFEEFAATIAYSAPRIPIVSNLTGELITTAPTARYWRDHLRGAVRFADGMTRLVELGITQFIEVGPTASLLGMGRRCLPDYQAAWLPSLRAGQSDWKVLSESIANYYVGGGTFDWRAWSGPVSSENGTRRVLLPSYPFDRARHWYDSSSAGRRLVKGSSKDHPLLGAKLPIVGASDLFEATLSANSPAYLTDHQVQGSVVAPGAAFVEQALAAATAEFGAGQHSVEQLQVQQALFLGPDPRRVQMAIAPEASGGRTFETYSAPIDVDGAPKWLLHAAGTLKKSTADAPAPIDLAAIRATCHDPKTKTEFYDIIAARGLKYGPQFQVLAEVDRSPSEAVTRLDPSAAVRAELGRYHLHPVLGDACLQTIACTAPLERDGSYSPSTYMPVHFGSVRVLGSLAEVTGAIYCYAVRCSPDQGPSPEHYTSDAFLVDETGAVLAEMRGVRVQRVGRAADGAAERHATDWLYRIAWRNSPLPVFAGDQNLAGLWLVFADNSSTSAELLTELERRQARCLVVRAGEEFRMVAGDSPHTQFEINPRDEAHYAKLLEIAAANPAAKLAGIVSLWSLGASDAGSANSCVGSALLLTKQAARRSLKTSAGMWFVSRQSLSVTADEVLSANAAAASAIVGLARVVQNEAPDLSVRTLDLDAESKAETIVHELLAAVHQQQADLEIAYRHGERSIARLEADRALAEALGAANSGRCETPRNSPFQLRITKPGSFDALRYQPVERKSPAAGQVEFAVHAAGLNFSDVLKALGLYPGIKDEIVPLGIEASGVVTAIGPGVTRFKVGDEVMGVAPYAFGSHATSADYALVKKPRNVSHAEACTIPITFLTAYYALVNLARLQPGERVLIHAGAGGVGLAAIQIAKLIGAEIFATAGSDDKRKLLRDLGVQHVFSSRDTAFAEQIREVTNREGVDVVLNSLPGEAITASIGVLRAYGRFLEIGKIDIYQNRMIGLLPFQDNLSYFAIDLDRMLRQRPQEVEQLFADVMARFTAGDYQPLPLTEFTAEETIGAFRYMSQRKNVGKVVVSLAEKKRNDVTANASPIHKQGSYLITGGLGALGLKLAAWLAKQGAGGLVLMGRRAPNDAQCAAIREFEAAGARVHCLQADAAQSQALQEALKLLPKELPPIRGVFHAAGVLDDGLLVEMSLDRLERTWQPKLAGAMSLHTALVDQPLDFFVLFSSVATVLGSPGQANYSASNGALDGFAAWRRGQGLPATTINWGPWADSGMAAEAGRDSAVQSKGMELLPADASLELLGKLLEVQPSQAIVMDARWEAMSKLLAGRKAPLLADLLVTTSGDTTRSRVDREMRERLIAAPPEMRRVELEAFVQQELARVMSVDAAQLEIQQPLSAFGIDSLMALELKNNLEAKLDFTLPMAKLLESPSIASLARDTADLLTGGEKSADESWAALMRLRPGDSSLEPLFLLPALGGDVSCYLQLIKHLETPRPLKAFRPRGLDGELPPHDNMNELVTDYVAAIRERQPKGPYYLAGWSTGGISAFAIAERLEAEGEKIALLALFDAPLPSVYANVNLEDDVPFLVSTVEFANRFGGHKIRVTAADLNPLPTNERFKFVFEAAKSAGMFSASTDVAAVQRLVKVGEALIKATRDYQPKPLMTTAHFFAPSIAGALVEAASQPLPSEEGWRQTVGQAIAKQRVIGDHFTMMTSVGAQQLALQLDQLLR